MGIMTSSDTGSYSGSASGSCNFSIPTLESFLSEQQYEVACIKARQTKIKTAIIAECKFTIGLLILKPI